MGLAHGPGLQLMHRIARWVEIVVPGDLGQLGAVATTLALVGFGPAQEFALRPQLASGIGRKGDDRHGGGGTYFVSPLWSCRPGG